MTYQEAIDYLYSRLPVFHLKGASAYKPGLDNTILLLQHLGNPHTKFKSVHIAGTNGKGSVSHLLASVLQESGYKTALFTSPHLVDFGERIRINGQMIEREYVADFVQNNLKMIEDIQPSFFELTMAMAFCYFAENDVDIAVIETGLGGRLDSTNILLPELSIITNIGFDHMEFLGNTLPKIAYEKAGIIKPGVPVVIGESLPDTKSVFELKAKECYAPIYFCDDEENPELIGIESNILEFRWKSKKYLSGLAGLYQLNNLRTVLKAIEVLNNSSLLDVKEISISNGFRNVGSNTGIRGRWERLGTNPLIIADTAHNSHGVRELVKQIAVTNFSSLRIVIGMVSDKDVDEVLSILPDDAEYYFTKADIQRAMNEEELNKKAEVFHLKGRSYISIESAVNQAIIDSDTHDLILITGSNFVVGEAISTCFT